MSFIFLLAVVVGLPLVSLISYRNIRHMEAETNSLEIPRLPLYFQSAMMQIAVAFLAWLAARAEKIEISIPSDFSTYSIFAAVGILLLGFVVSWLDVRRNKNPEEEANNLHYILPSNLKERLAWLMAIAMAAFCEEYIYRGVLFEIIKTYVGGQWIWAALLSAIVFGFGHGTQGEKAILTIIPFAIIFQVIVYFSGGLLLAMITHFIYNAAVDLFFARLIREKAKSKSGNDPQIH